ncbi:FAD:protein FMN transferase [Burkholderia sp. Bp9012]|uniref:FAD:protein FMN transferase n=1 Tax=Burkholderia sp. Bp9012 TaxID=2184562 RepID=UPI001C893FC8|nr:FAD:protein FMN transferase [Burkholderia sp. Bp9012]
MNDDDAVAVLANIRFPAMGTQIGVTVVGDDRDVPIARSAVDDVRTAMLAFGRDFWAWGDGRLAALNRELAAGRAITIPHDMLELFALAWRHRQSTDGRYEPRIGELVRLWGFHDVDAPGSQPPARDEIGRLLQAIADAPHYDGGGNYGPAPGVAWDFGGIGKGFIVDHCLDLLSTRGFRHTMIDAGGNLAVRGRRGERRWRVGIRDPRGHAGQQQLLAALDVESEAVVTHGDDQRFFEYQGERYAHVLDPLIGRPVRGLRSLTVVDRDATRADAEGAALYVAGANGWHSLAARLGFDQVMAVLDDGKVVVTRELARRLVFADGITIDVV